MRYRRAMESDVGLLARMNRQLIEDEGHSNPMTLAELEERMRGWLWGEFCALLFEDEDGIAAYVIYRRSGDSVFLRQFFVARTHRRRGVGRRVMQILLGEVWPPGRRVLVEVLARNAAGRAFWHAVGFSDYSVTMEMKQG